MPGTVGRAAAEPQDADKPVALANQRGRVCIDAVQRPGAAPPFTLLEFTYGTSVLVYLGDTLTGHSYGGQIAALALALSVIAATGVGIVLSARIAYGIASYKALPAGLANVSQRFRTPAVATVVASVILLALGWIYLLTTSVQNAFSYVLDNTGILYATFYCITALAAMVYYRRRVLSNVSDAITLGLLPLASIVFLGYVAIKSILSAPAAQNYSLLGFVVVGLVLLLIARFGWRSSFFETRQESWKPGSETRD